MRAALLFFKETVTGAEVVFIMLKPTTCPAIFGELPFKISPCEEYNVKTATFVVGEDCVATHQLIVYLPGSLKVISPELLS
ncbi:hypothetical protein CG710_002270 [Lachnotalea glycerini]|uniref:Uncharacterized protein n=1 Tax=Lachnotalea glycerini TaxID=1763509 RepID=A0A371JJ99_9FIRM|nr:hypothetical protein CG710_002270 [Lachnotalea glycerini]